MHRPVNKTSRPYVLHARYPVSIISSSCLESPTRVFSDALGLAGGLPSVPALVVADKTAKTAVVYDGNIADAKVRKVSGCQNNTRGEGVVAVGSGGRREGGRRGLLLQGLGR